MEEYGESKILVIEYDENERAAIQKLIEDDNKFRNAQRNLEPGFTRLLEDRFWDLT